MTEAVEISGCFSMVPAESEEFPYDIAFSTEECHGIIRTFDVSENSWIATNVRNWDVNVYDDIYYAYSIHPSYSHCHSTVQWEGDTLVIYVAMSGNERFAIRVNGFEDYEVYSIPDTEENQQLWDALPFDVKSLERNGNHYFMSEGNLLYQPDGQEGTLYIADNAFFHPAILLAPIVIPLCIYVFVKRKTLFHIEQPSEKNEE